MENNPNSIRFGLKEIEVIDFHELSLGTVISKNNIQISINDSSVNIDTVLDSMIKFTFDSGVNYLPEAKNKNALLAYYFIKIEYGIGVNPEQIPAPLLGLEARYTFEIIDESKKLQFSELEPIADDLAKTFAPVVFSTTRGLLYGLIKSPIMHKIVLPLLPMNEVSELFKLPQRPTVKNEKMKITKRSKKKA